MGNSLSVPPASSSTVSLASTLATAPRAASPGTSSSSLATSTTGHAGLPGVPQTGSTLRNLQHRGRGATHKPPLVIRQLDRHTALAEMENQKQIAAMLREALHGVTQWVANIGHNTRSELGGFQTHG